MNMSSNSSSNKMVHLARAVARRLLLQFPSAHDRHWGAHPAVATGEDLTFGQRMADRMRSGLGTWTFLIVLAGIMALWIATSGFGRDAFPYILLNLCLSTLAGIQAAVLLIAAKRSDQIAAATALHTLENTEQLRTLLEQNTALTEQVAALTRTMHDHITSERPTMVLPALGTTMNTPAEKAS